MGWEGRGDLEEKKQTKKRTTSQCCTRVLQVTFQVVAYQKEDGERGARTWRELGGGRDERDGRERRESPR